jgi:hypothetical protein
MTIWVGYDGMLYDDGSEEVFVGQDGGDGLGGLGDIASSLGSDGADSGGAGSFGSTLSDLGSSLGSAFGSSSMPSGADGSSGGGLGGIGSDLSNLFSGTGSSSSALGDVFGKLAKTALPAVTQAAEGALTKATSRSSQPQMPVHPALQSQSPQATPVHPALQHPALPSRGGGGGPPVAHVRQKHDVDPKVRLNLLLSHLAKKYNLPPPAKPPGFVSKMMGHPT